MCKIHRDAFSYGAVAENIDTRLIVDFRFFGYAEPQECNRIVFQQHYTDAYGMPQPTFKFQLSEDDRERCRRMMDEYVFGFYPDHLSDSLFSFSMCSIALEVGGFLPGSEPQFMTPGLPLHLAGTTRAGYISYGILAWHQMLTISFPQSRPEDDGRRHLQQGLEFRQPLCGR